MFYDNSNFRNSVDAALTEVLALDSLNHPGIVKYNHSWVETPPGRFQVRDHSKKKLNLNF